jgi:N-acetyl-anhydromuramyl-L-alanine amidase AmpD
MLLLAMFMSMFFGYGVFKQRKRRPKKTPDYSPKQIQEKLLKFGYQCPQTGEFDAETSTVITAFQRHFRRKSLTGKWDSECSEIIDSLLAAAR